MLAQITTNGQRQVLTLPQDMDNIIDPVKKQNVLSLYNFAQEHIELNVDILKRAFELQKITSIEEIANRIKKRKFAKKPARGGKAAVL